MPSVILRTSDHTYWHDKAHTRSIIGVSKILELAGLASPYQKPRHKNMCPKFLDEDEECTCGAETGLKFGKATHEMIRLFEFDKLDEKALDPGLANVYTAYKRFRADRPHYQLIYDPDGPLAERSLYSEGHDFAGTPDLPFLNKKKNRVVVVDAKTSNVAVPEWELQTSGYEVLLREHLKINRSVGVDRLALRLLFDNPEPVIKPLIDPTARQTFLAARVVARWQQRFHA